MGNIFAYQFFHSFFPFISIIVFALNNIPSKKKPKINASEVFGVIHKKNVEKKNSIILQPLTTFWNSKTRWKWFLWVDK